MSQCAFWQVVEQYDVLQRRHCLRLLVEAAHDAQVLRSDMLTCLVRKKEYWSRLLNSTGKLGP